MFKKLEPLIVGAIEGAMRVYRVVEPYIIRKCRHPDKDLINRGQPSIKVIVTVANPILMRSFHI